MCGESSRPKRYLDGSTTDAVEQRDQWRLDAPEGLVDHIAANQCVNIGLALGWGEPTGYIPASFEGQDAGGFRL